MQQGLYMYRKYRGFLHFVSSSSQSKPAKNTGIYSVLTRQHAKKHDVLNQFFTVFQLVLLHSKNDHSFILFLLPLIRTQEGVKSGQICKLHLSSTFFFVTLFDESNTKNWGRLFGPQNAVNYGALWRYHAFYLQKRAAKADLC